MKIFTIYDKKSLIYGNPFYNMQIGQAERTFSQAINDSSNPNNLLAKYPTDFELYEIGSFDANTGQITPLEKPNFINNGGAYVENK